MELEEVIKNIEEEQIFTRGVTSRIFKSMLNQPSLVSVNSANAVKTESENGYYSFTIDFPRPVLDVDTIQLLTTSIPQANASIPDTSIAFWYYRLSAYTGTTPSLNNLYCVRLLPSYYKPEFINNPTNYGWNKTFNSYQKLSDELAKSCVMDLGYYNLENYLKPYQTIDAFYQFPFLPSDTTIAYNPTYNKFQMTGNSRRIAAEAWNSLVSYTAGFVVFYVSGGITRTYTSLQNSNLNHIPSADDIFDPTWWQLTSNEIVALWNATTLYAKGNIVRKLTGGITTLYIALRDTINDNPPDSGADWAETTNTDKYTYLITGYDDPNVAIKQGEIFNLPYNPNRYYQTGERVTELGRVFRATTETSIYTPGNIDQRSTTTPIVYYNGQYLRTPNPVWSAAVTYPKNFVVFLNGITYVSIKDATTPPYDPNVNNNPPAFPDYWQPISSPIQNWTVLTPNPINIPLWSQFNSYKVGDLVYDEGLAFKCTVANSNSQPNVSLNVWQLQASHPYDATEWINVGANMYNAGDCANYQGQLWVANETTSILPQTPYWTPLGYTVWNNYNYADRTPVVEDTEIYFNGQYYTRNATVLNTIQPVPNWRSDVFYPVNTIIQDEGEVFRCLIPNQGNEPEHLATTWSAVTTYEIGQTAVINGIEYVCQIKNLNVSPANPVPNWTNANAYVPFNIVFVPGVQSYRCTNPVGPSPTPPNGDGGNWQGVFGGNNISNVWVPSNVGYWVKIVDSNWDTAIVYGDKSGLSGLSHNCDFLEHDGVGSPPRPDFPRGIPGQPYNPSPERLFNSILGFTWNGIFDPAQLTNLNPDFITGRFITLYNRLRPVPLYEVAPTPAPLLEDNPAPTASITRTYTAEGYANLVYSSIVNIYTNIIGGSTLDTVRNTNLVATTSMNCGNLGIAFHGNYIDTPLQRVAGDINQLTIELRDEVGEPFYLTNNAIMTATFKITYKDGNVRIEEPA